MEMSMTTASLRGNTILITVTIKEVLFFKYKTFQHCYDKLVTVLGYGSVSNILQIHINHLKL